ncbi:MAG: hypothetical protein UIC45_00305 [Paludibacteraceae bacterium]|nr:hypothetical protein [Paludibacteraceae bacterium]
MGLLGNFIAKQDVKSAVAMLNQCWLATDDIINRYKYSSRAIERDDSGKIMASIDFFNRQKTTITNLIRSNSLKPFDITVNTHSGGSCTLMQYLNTVDKYLIDLNNYLTRR